MTKNKATPVSVPTPTPLRKLASAAAKVVPARKVTPAEDRAARAECKRFIELFGRDFGLQCYLDGLTIPQARERMENDPIFQDKLEELRCRCGSEVVARMVLDQERRGVKRDLSNVAHIA